MKQFLLSIFMLLPMMASADAVEINGIYYNLNSEKNQAEVTTNPNKYTGDVKIPEKVPYNDSEYNVTSIGNQAFSGCSGLTSVTIPISVTSIGVIAFQGCTGLTSITIPNSVTSIGDLAFSFCTGLTSITIPNNVTTIGGSAFQMCSGLSSIKVESGNPIFDSRDNCNAIVQTSSNTLIQGCNNTIIPNSVTSIGNRAFQGCTDLTSITIPNSVTSIGSDAFRDCSGLTSVTIPNSVKSVGEWAFSGCSGLTSITIPNNLTSIEWGAFYWCTGLTSVTIPNSVTSIVNWAFGGCSGLTSITIPNSVTSIGSIAFDGCRGLTSITIPNSVTSIGNRAFENCSGLTSIVSEIDDLFEITENVFPISNTIVLTIPVGTKSAYLSTAGWNKFKNIFEVGEEIIVIGQVYNSGGIYYKIGENNTVSVTSGESKYSGDIIIPSQVVFGKTSYSVTSIDNRAFYGCDGLTSITIPNSVTNIGQEVFRNCSGLTSITIPNSVTSIGDLAFSFCTGLTSITIPNNVTTIGEYAFYGCSGLTSIVSEIDDLFEITENVFPISNTIVLTIPVGTKSAYLSTAGWNKFKNIFEVGEEIIVIGQVYESGGIYYKIDVNNTVSVISGESKYSGDIIIPSQVVFGKTSYSVTSIDYHAFYGCDGLTSITIPNSVTDIGSQAFYYCSGLTSVTIPNSVTRIGMCAFSGCSSLTSIRVESGNPKYDSRDGCNAIVETSSNKLIQGCNNTTISNSVTSIGENAFRYYSALTSVTIPNSVTSIGEYAFDECSALTSVIIPKSVASIDECAFYNNSLTYIKIEAEYPPLSDIHAFSRQTYINAILAVPIGTKDKYQSTEGWKNFDTIVEVEAGAYTGLEVAIDGLLYRIGENNTASVIAKRNSYGDPIGDYSGDILIPDKVYYIGVAYKVISVEDEVFRSCNSLTSVIIPNSVISIGKKTFYGCTNMKSVTIGKSVATIGDAAFEYCWGLNSVTIPNSVTSIGIYAFSASHLITIISEIEDPFSINKNVFKEVPSNAQLVVPVGTKEKYLATEGWNRFINIIEGNSPEEEGDDEEDDDDFNALGTPLTFEAIEGTVTVNVRNYFCSNTPTIQYRVDNGPWTDFKLTHTECCGNPLYSNFIPAGKIVQLRCNDWPYMLNRLDESSQADGLSIQCDADCYVYGNVMSLETYYYSTDYDKECTLSWLFYQNTHIKNHPKKPLVLPSKTLGMNCYTGMFYGCTGLTMAPELSATELPGCDSYRGGCYESMFQDCTSLTVAPVLPASVLTESCYKKMFYGCTNLNTVTNYATDISAKDATQKWLFGVSSTGTFTKLPVMNGWGEGASGIPFGWIVVMGSSQGDVNGDGALDENDLKVLENHIMGNPQEEYFDLNVADMNNDGKVNVADLVLMLNIINQK